ncbi:conserved hypothetical protein [Aspergillus terreus NIH2624]|uniref:Tat pathway signal sequence n=1 Tax=Aspergillus terreus (strain NIH 2624 / FGSC A1156) TaxID=341663 RepID=Q0CBV7_ASPTN|nr:uncharacterized protein ATEG_08827 [Aspergillus terreus NIH2624]EAU30959.1 conserved hypothetical protein [Aspergillus terreus NIH2624]
MDARNIIYKVIKPRRSLASSYSTTGEDSESLLEKKQVFQRRHSWWEISRSSYIWAAHTIFFLFSLSFFLSGLQQRYPTEQQCARQLSAYSPALDAVEYEMVRFQGALLDENPYKVGQIKVGPSDLTHLKKPPTQAKLRSTDGEWYTGGLEVFHQLHCVNLIRQYTYLDYYSRPENRPPSFTDSNHTLRLHIDHCIDMLRQVVQCQGDAGIVTSSWVEGFPDPVSRF